MSWRLDDTDEKRDKFIPPEGVRTPEVDRFADAAERGGQERRDGESAHQWETFAGWDGPYERRVRDDIRLTVRWRPTDGWVWTMVSKDAVRRGGWVFDRSEARTMAERYETATRARRRQAEIEWARRDGAFELDQTGPDYDIVDDDVIPF